MSKIVLELTEAEARAVGVALIGFVLGAVSLGLALGGWPMASLNMAVKALSLA